MSPFRPGKWDLLWLGLAIGLGGQFFNWNAGLRAGLYSFLLAFALVAMAYVALGCCAAEVAGALPFAGGAFGLSRCTLGLFAGFVVGAAEALEYVTYVSTAVLALTDMLAEVAPALAPARPALALALYAGALAPQLRGGRLFWRCARAVGALALASVLLYVAGGLPAADFARNADDDARMRFVGGARGFVEQLPRALWFFVGLEALPLAADAVRRPRAAVPFAQLALVAALLLAGAAALLVTVSLPPAGLARVAALLAPFDFGFQRLLLGAADSAGAALATLCSVPAMGATAFGFMWGYGQLVQALAASRLLPPALAQPHARFGSPANALLAGSALSFAVFLLVDLAPAVKPVLDNVCLAAACLGYAAQCLGFLALRLRHPAALRASTFRSPLGVPGALFALAVFSLAFASLCGFQGHGGAEPAALAALLAALAAFYAAYARDRQTLSPQEARVFLRAHVIKRARDSRRAKAAIAAAAVFPAAFPAAAVAAHAARPSAAASRAPERLCLPTADPAKAETPFGRHFAHRQPADTRGPRLDAAAATCDCARIHHELE